MKSRQAGAGSISTRAFAAAPRAPCTASPGRSSVFDGIQAQYEHSPPTSSRSTTATRSPPSASVRHTAHRGSPTDDDDVIVDTAIAHFDLLIPLHPLFIGSSGPPSGGHL